MKKSEAHPLASQAKDNRLGEMTDAFTGAVFTPRARNHYEVNIDPPKAPPVDLARPTVRQRIENLINRGVDPLAHYVGSDDYDFDIPDDPEAPLTASEMNFMDAVAAEIAEAAPLPDEGLPRPDGALKPASPPSGVQGAAPPAVGAPAPGPGTATN